MEIKGIGVDIIEIERVKKAYEKESFREKYYTEEEQNLIQQNPIRCSTAFAGKEAVVKALGTGFEKISPVEIAILRNEKGAPEVALYGNALKEAKKQGIMEWKISLSDSKTQAVAYVVAQG